MSSPIQSARLPELVGPPALLEGPPRECWLDRVRTCRRRLRATRQRQHADLSDQAVTALDQLLGLLLLIRFVRDRRPSVLPAEAIGQAEGSPRTLCQGVWQAVRSPLLRAVFDPTDFDDTKRMVETGWRVGAAIDLGGRDQAGRIVPLPPTAFGEFHQLCLAEQDAGEAGQRRARGVHYTPVSLADYLTSRILDRVEESYSDGTPLRILDPSCGGGTFLLAALRRLLQRQAALSPQETLDLLGKSLYGIDIDPQAVVWTRRALLLAAWEALLASNDEAADAGLLVPDWRRNIICRDFLGPDRTSPDGFPSEFHAILGGPPFVRIHELLRIDPGRVERYRAEYRTARAGQFDLFMPFFEEAIRRLCCGGWLGWSVSSTFLRTASGQRLRSLLGGSCTIHELTEFEDRKIYPDAVTQIVLALLEKGQREAPCRHVWVVGRGGLRDKLATLWRGTDRHAHLSVRELPASTFWRSDWSFTSATERSLLARLREAGTPLGRLPVSIIQGVVTGADPVFLLRRLGSTEDGETLVQGRDRRQHLLLESAVLRPVVRNRNIQGYGRLLPRTMCLTPYDSSGRLLPEAVLRTRYPKAYRYLLRHRDTLTRRQGIEPEAWYALRSASCLMMAAGPRVMLKLICSGGDFMIDCEGRYLGHAGTLLLVADQRQVDPFYLLGVLNSRVFWFFVRQTMPTMGEGRHVLRRSTLRRFPLVVSGPSQDAQQQIAAAVRGLVVANETLPERPQLLANIERLVAQLYGIDPAELLAEIPER